MSDAITQQLGGLVHYLDGIQIDDDGSQGLPSSVNVGPAPVIPQTRGTGGHSGTTKNKYANFFSHMDEKSDIDIGLNKVIVPKNKQDSYGYMDYLHNVDLSTAPL